MTVPARYTLTEAHFKIAELEREKARLQQALAEIRKRCREGHGDDLIAVTADEALAPEAVRALVRLREMLYDATITYSSFCAKCGPMDDADPADPKYLGSPMMTETLPLREVVEKALAGQDRPHRQEWDRRRGEPRTGITGEARPDTPADSPPPRSEYGGYMGGEPWGAPADGQCVDTDLATLRRIIESVRPDAVPAVARVEAELSRLREHKISLMRRCARLQQALADADEARRGIIAACIAVKGKLDAPYPDDNRWTPWQRFIEPALRHLDEALAGLDTPAAEDEAWEKRSREVLYELSDALDALHERAEAAEARCAQLEAEALAFDNVRAAYDDLIEERDAAGRTVRDLEEQRDDAQEELQAAEARCARLQQALKARHRWLADALSRNQIVHETDRARARAFIADWEALAGPDTPTHRKQNVEYWRARSRVAEAACARLQQALERVRENAKAWHGPDGLRTGHAHALAVIAQWCDETLAGPDTPADICPECAMGVHVACLDDGSSVWTDRCKCDCGDTPADDEPCSCCDGEGCAYCTSADSQEDKT